MNYTTEHTRRLRATRKSQLGLLAASIAVTLLGCATDTSDGLGGTGGTTSSDTVTATTGTASMTSGSTVSGTASSSSGMSLCDMDCTQINTGECLKAVCNDGSYPGEIGKCVAVADVGASCDDETFCTTDDKCDADAKCIGGPPNDCGMTPGACKAIQCNEAAGNCTEIGAFIPNTPCTDGAECPSGSCTANKCDPPSCVPTDLCTVNAVCNATGQCVGTPKDCSFSPLTECNAVACNPADGKCVGTPDTAKNGSACQLTGDLCKSGKTCNAGMCQGGTPKDCSALTQDCTLGVCNAANGACQAQPIPAGGMCDDASDECNQGFCDNMGMCNPMPIVGISCPSAVDECNTGTCDAAGVCGAVPVMNGSLCNDHDACTSGDTCSNGSCSGSPVAGCQSYYIESFETCPAGWTFGGEWQCGVAATTVSSSHPPTGAHQGTNVIGTNLAGAYVASDAYANVTATSPTINLTNATNPILVFYMWVDSEGSTYDGANLRISQDGGAFNLVGSGTSCTAANSCTPIPVSKPYNATLIGSQPAWGGLEYAQGWQAVTVDLTSFVGHQIQLRYSFRSDTIVQYSGIYIDDLTLGEANAIPLNITTSALPDGYASNPYAITLSKTGGTATPTWSIQPGGTNTSWLTINPSTGQLSGNPTAANVGPVIVTIRVEEPSLPSNFDDQTFTFNVGNAYYAQGFEGACPNAWTLTGDWQCGAPTYASGPAAFSGNQVLGTVLTGTYNTSQTWAGTTATSPTISLAGATAPKLKFQAWIETEGSTYDAVNVLVSTNGGASFTQLLGVTPAYNVTVGGQQGWGGHPTPVVWAPYQADLSAYAGQNIMVRFAFQSDGSVQYAGAYIDSLVVTE